jgi:hypothetical protein
MATATRSDDPLSVAGWTVEEESSTKSDRYLAARLAAAAAEYRRVTVLTFVLACVFAGLVWFALGGLLEHWIVPHGLPLWARWAWLVTALVGLGTAILVWLVPLLRYRVNLVYAARAIEAEHPELHNDLVNTVLVKARPEAGQERVARMLERRAARELSQVPADEGVADQRPAVRLAAGVLALIVAALLYEMLGAKSLVASAARLVAPWSGLAVPARVKIGTPQCSWRQPGEDGRVADDPLRRLDIEAGAVTLVRGRQLVVTTEIRGLAADERPVVLATPLRDDGAAPPQATPWRIAMSTAAAKSAGGLPRQRAVLPDALRGLEHGVELVVVAGDAQSNRLRVAVVDTPSLLVREVRYDYPAYTGLGTETVAWQGDLRAVEGTRATLLVEGNRPLEKAWLDLDCDGKPNKELRIAPHDLARASGGIDLLLKPDRSGPAHDSYRLMFAARGAANTTSAGWVTEKLEHRIEVLPDLAPEVSIEDPRQQVMVVPPDAPVQIRVRALDPDFGLTRVTVETRLRNAAGQEGEPRSGRPLLDEVWRGVFEGAGVVVPEHVGAGSGSVLEYRAVAVDTRPREPNIVATPWQSLKIDSSAPPLEQPPLPPPQRGGNDRQGDSKADHSPNADDSQDGAGGTVGNDDRRKDGSGRDGDVQDRDGRDRAAEAPPGGEQAEPRPNGAADTPRGDSSPRDPSSPPAAAKDGSPAQAESGDASQDPPPQSTDRPEDGSPGSGGRKSMAPGAETGSGPQSEQGTESAPSNRPGADGRGRDQPQPGQGGEDRRPDGGGEGANGRNSGAGAGGETENGVDGGNRGTKPDETVASDGTNDGEALERILDHRRQQGAAESDPSPGQGRQERGEGTDQGGEQPGPGDRTSSEPPGNDSTNPDRGMPDGSPQQGDPQQGDPRGEGAGRREPDATNAQGAQDEQRSEPAADTKDGGNGQPGGSSEGKDGAAGRSGEGQQGQPGQGQPGQGEPGQGEPGQGEPGQSQPGQSQPGQSQPGQSQPGQSQPGQSQPGQSQPGQGQPGQGQPGQGQPGQGQPGQGQPGETPPGGQQPGEAKSGDGESGGRDAAAGSTRGGDAAAPGSAQPQAGRDERAEDRSGGERGRGTTGRETTDPAPPGSGAADSAGEEAAGGQAQDADGEPQPGGGGRVGGGRVGGGQSQDAAVAADEEPVARELEWGDQDLAHARNAADLAIEHLRDSMAAGRRDVLDALGWTPEQAEAFLARWQTLRQLAGSEDPRQRGEFERTLRSLGLRPDGVRSSRESARDVKGGAAEGRRGRPPASYRDQFKAYQQGTGGP